MTTRNPKQEGSILFDARPQVGPCPMNCSQCFYNRPGAFYVDINQPQIPTPEEVGDGICRMNCGHDSNIERDKVIACAKQYKHFFFNTSIPKFDFPGPVVLTANPREEEPSWMFPEGTPIPLNLMFVRLRVSATNLKFVREAVEHFTRRTIPVTLTFMAYYEKQPVVPQSAIDELAFLSADKFYVFKKRTLNDYWCPTDEFMIRVWGEMLQQFGYLVTLCGGSDKCKDCHNCDSYYWQTMKRLRLADFCEKLVNQ